VKVARFCGFVEVSHTRSTQNMHQRLDIQAELETLFARLHWAVDVAKAECAASDRRASRH
jgi:hypothetical protein